MQAQTTPTIETARKLTAYCSQGENIKAIEELYADDVVSIEAFEMPGHQKQLSGKEAVLGKTRWWLENHEVHGGETKGPFPSDGNRFGMYFKFEVTPKVGPMAGNRMTMEEVALYYTNDQGKINREEFYYSME